MDDSELRETIKLLARCIDELAFAVQDLQKDAGIDGSTWRMQKRVELVRRTAALIVENTHSGLS